MVVDVRSALSAGIAAGLVAAACGAAVMSPVATAPLPVMASPAVQLSALAAALPQPAAAKPTKPGTGPFGGGGAAGSPGQRIINGYNAIQPWVQYSVELGAWGVGWLPFPINLAAPQMTIGYSGIEPLSRATVYSVAYALDGQWNLIAPTVKNGIDTAYTNVVRGEISYVASYFPPRPPLGGGAAVATPALSRARVKQSVPAPAAAAAAAAAAVAVDMASEPAGSSASSATTGRQAPATREHKSTRTAAKRTPGAASSAVRRIGGSH